MAGSNGTNAMAWTASLSVVAFYIGDRWGMLASTHRNLIEGLAESLSPDLAYEILLDPLALSFDTVPLLCGLTLLVAVWYAYLNLVQQSHEVRDGDEHGAARLGTIADTRAYADHDDPSNNVILTKNVRMAIRPGAHVRRVPPSSNVIVFGATGTGKTAGFVLPNILQLADRDMVVVDPKGQTLASCGHALAAAGFDITVVNTVDMAASDRYNPLATIETHEDVLDFATMLVDATNAGRPSGERIWDDGEVLLYRALITLLLDWFPREELTFKSLVRLIDLADVPESGDAPSPLDLIFDEIATGERWEPDTACDDDAFTPRGADGTRRAGLVRVPSLMRRRDGMRPALETRAGGGHGTDDDEALTVWREFKKGSARTLRSFIISAHTRLAHITTPEVLALLSGDDGIDEVRPDLLGQTEDELGRPLPPRILFAVSSDFSRNLRPLVSILMWQCLRQTMRAADASPTGRLPRHVSLVLDEFKNVGRLEGFEEAVAVVRSRNIDIEILLQTASQLSEVYGEHGAKTIRGNCATQLFLGGGRDFETAKVISEELGKMTAHKRERSYQRSASGTSTSTSVASLGRDLLDPSEVAELSFDKALVLIGQEHAVVDEKAHVRLHRNYDATYMGADPTRRFDFAAWRAAGRPKGVALDAWEEAWFGLELPARDRLERAERAVRLARAKGDEGELEQAHAERDEAAASLERIHADALHISAEAIAQKGSVPRDATRRGSLRRLGKRR